MAQNKLVILMFIAVCASSVSCIRPLRLDGAQTPAIVNDHGRGLRLFGGVLLKGLAKALKKPAQGEFLRALAKVMAGKAGKNADVAVEDGVLSITGVEGSEDFKTEIQTDPVTGLSYTIDPTTGAQIFVDPLTGLPITDNGSQIQFENSGFVAAGPGAQFDQLGQGLTPGLNNGVSASVDPNTGFSIDPNTGLPIDPNTGLAIDPNTGLPVDPNTGLPIDPNTGLTIDPNTGRPVNPLGSNPVANLGGNPQIQYDQFGQAFTVDSFGQRIPVDPVTGAPIASPLGQQIPTGNQGFDPVTGRPLPAQVGFQG